MGNIRIILFFFFLPRILFSAKDTKNIFIDAEHVNKSGKTITLTGNVIAKTKDFILTAKKLFLSDEEDVYTAEDDVKINLNNKDVKMICKKCIYNVNEGKISFFDVEIVFNKTTIFITHYCDYIIAGSCLKYNEYGKIKHNGNILLSKNGEISVDEGKVFLHEDVMCKNEHLCLQCNYFLFSSKDKKAIFKEKILIKFTNMANLIALVEKKVIYDADDETFTADKLTLLNKEMKGFFSDAKYKQNKINLYNGVIKTNNNHFRCKNILYDIEKQKIVLKENPYIFLQNGIIFTSNDLHIENL